jgi:hypothetical protein
MTSLVRSQAVGSLSPTSPSEVHNPLDAYLLLEYINECKIIVIRTALASSRRILPLIPAKSYGCARLCSAENVSALFSAASARLQAKHPGWVYPALVLPAASSTTSSLFRTLLRKCAKFSLFVFNHLCTLPSLFLTPKSASPLLATHTQSALGYTHRRRQIDTIVPTPIHFPGRDTTPYTTWQGVSVASSLCLFARRLPRPVGRASVASHLSASAIIPPHLLRRFHESSSEAP